MGVGARALSPRCEGDFMHARVKVPKRGATVRFLALSAASMLGNSVSGVVLPLVLLATTGNALAAGALAVICAIPQLIAGVVGGGLLDRFNRRNFSALSDAISALAVGLLPVVDMTVGLSFWWFVALGVLGAIGDVPGMTARDALMPAIARYDEGDLQRCVGLKETLENLASAVGPAVASLALAVLGGTGALWVTAALSLSAAVITLSLPHEVGVCPESIEAGTKGDADGAGCGVRSPRRGLCGLFCGHSLLRASVVLGLAVTMAAGGLQGIVLPAYFTQIAQTDRLGFVVSALALGMLSGSLVYARWMGRLSNRTWLVSSFLGMACALGVLCLLPAYPLMIAAAAATGFAAGPITALLNYYVYALVPEACRGASMGVLNSLYLAAAPISVLTCSLLVSLLGPQIAALFVAAAFLVPMGYALLAPAMRHLSRGEATGTPSPRRG